MPMPTKKQRATGTAQLPTFEGHRLSIHLGPGVEAKQNLPVVVHLFRNTFSRPHILLELMTELIHGGYRQHPAGERQSFEKKTKIRTKMRQHDTHEQDLGPTNSNVFFH